ncbi:Siroheme synthase [Halomonadaceae bacterium LMG 33818]|uniref:uroporphyrinogen-III C-methyltransferase n=1 Tax=Cernens ardua TaxID=3402176 RepID=UPI003EDB9D53
MTVDVTGKLGFFELHLFGEGKEALTLAQRLKDAVPHLALHGAVIAEPLSRLASQQGWIIEHALPEAKIGQCWLIATSADATDLPLIERAEKAGIAIFAPGHPERSNVYLSAETAPQPTAHSSDNTGFVSLVGAGPGDPSLLTLKALERLQQADILVYDRLVSQEVLALASPTAKRLYVGKARSNHSVPQSDINQTLVDWARQGYRVVRLKGGDSFIFGRGGEELELLAQEQIPFEVVPGITAALGVSSYAGIPLTHRNHAQSVRFVTGHLKNGSVDLDWTTLAAPGQTLVFYMGLGSLKEITHQLIAHGVNTSMPIALVEQGTTARQQVHTGTLSTIEEVLSGVTIAPPTLIIVGGVVGLHPQLQWFDQHAANSLGWQHGKHPSP